MSEPNWGVDPGTTPPTRDDAWFPPPVPSYTPAQPPQYPMQDGSSSGPAPSGPDPLASADLASTPASPLPPSSAGVDRGASSPRSPSGSCSRSSSGSPPVGSPRTRVRARSWLVPRPTPPVVPEPISTTPAPLTGKEADPAAAVAKAAEPCRRAALEHGGPRLRVHLRLERPDPHRGARRVAGTTRCTSASTTARSSPARWSAPTPAPTSRCCASRPAASCRSLRLPLGVQVEVGQTADRARQPLRARPDGHRRHRERRRPSRPDAGQR